MERGKEIIKDNDNIKPILLFLNGSGTDIHGRTLPKLWEKSYFFLEFSHDYIQWMFPLNENSKYNSNAPVLSDYEIQFIQNNMQIQVNMLKSLDVMLRFYGFERNKLSIQKSTDFKRKSKRWLTKNNHNFLRITRILKSLTLCGLDAYSDAFFEVLVSVYKEYSVITDETLYYWDLKHILIDKTH